MDDYIVRVLEIMRLLPKEIQILHGEESRTELPIDYDPTTGTCAGFVPRTPRCWFPSEIQRSFHQPPLKDYYNLAGSGMFADQQMADRVDKISRVVRNTLFNGSSIVFATCSVCHWTETLWDGIWITGEVGGHPVECLGTPRPNVVRDMAGAAQIAFSMTNVEGMHALDEIIDRKRDALFNALNEFRDAKNKPKSRVERIKEEAKNATLFGTE